MKDRFARRENQQVLECQVRKSGGARWPSSAIAARKTGATNLMERYFITAYLSLFVMPAKQDGSKIAALARFGTYEVRLVEFPGDACDETPPLWVELYRYDLCSVIDSFRCDDFDEAVMAAETFILRAKALYEQGASTTREKLAQDVMERLRDAGFSCDLLAQAGD
jgi:hypothetical protein